MLVTINFLLILWAYAKVIATTNIRRRDQGDSHQKDFRRTAYYGLVLLYVDTCRFRYKSDTKTYARDRPSQLHSRETQVRPAKQAMN